MSEWQTPQKRMSICTSSGPGSRRSKENGFRSPFAESVAYPLVEIIVIGDGLFGNLKGSRRMILEGRRVRRSETAATEEVTYCDTFLCLISLRAMSWSREEALTDPAVRG